MVCSWSVHGLSMVCLWFIHGLCMVCPFSVHGLCMVYPWSVRGLCMVCPWSVHYLSYSGLFFAPSLLSSFFFACPGTMMLMLMLMLSVSQIACMYAQEVWGTLHASLDFWTCRLMDSQTMDGTGGGERDPGRPTPLPRIHIPGFCCFPFPFFAHLSLMLFHLSFVPIPRDPHQNRETCTKTEVRVYNM